MIRRVESKGCRNIRYFMLALYIVCIYLLTTTYAIDVLEVITFTVDDEIYTLEVDSEETTYELSGEEVAFDVDGEETTYEIANDEVTLKVTDTEFIFIADDEETAYDVDSEEVTSYMTAINLAFGTLASSTPVRKNMTLGIIFIAIPLLGVGFTVFDRRSNIKNVVSFICSIVGVVTICMVLGGYMGAGALASAVVYMVLAILSAVAFVMNIQDRNSDATAPKLTPHDK